MFPEQNSQWDSFRNETSVETEKIMSWYNHSVSIVSSAIMRILHLCFIKKTYQYLDGSKEVGA